MIQPLDRKTLTEIFMNVIHEKFSDPAQVAAFATPPDRYHHDGVDARLLMAGNIADTLVGLTPLKGLAALSFTTTAQADILDRADRRVPPGTETIGMLADSGASEQALGKAFETLMQEAARAAAGCAISLLAADQITPGTAGRRLMH